MGCKLLSKPYLSMPIPRLKHLVLPLHQFIYAFHFAFFSDPLVTSLVQDIFKELCANKPCHAQIQARLLPTLISILTASPDKLPLGLQSVSL